jgi:hypothetical protein
MNFWRWAVAPFVACLALAQPVVSLKTRPLGGARPIAGPHMPLKRKTPERRHWIVQFAEAPRAEQVAALSERGATTLEYAPDFGLVVAARDDTAFDDIGARWASPLDASDKLSPTIAADTLPGAAQHFIAGFYSDVSMDDARAIALEAGLRIVENAYLLDHDLLIEGAVDQVAALAEWDELEYIFPASDDLVQGAPVASCAGALTTQGKVGQSVARVGDGWDGPGLGAANLAYAFQNVTNRLDADAAKAEIVRAFNEWAKYAKLSFTPASDTHANRTLSVLFGSRAHGDPYPFDGPGGVLAHTFYPFPTNPEPVAGDLHFDADESWRIGADTDLFSVALHETGHALGLGHSDNPAAVMYPYYRKVTGLNQEDIGAILNLYAAQDGGTPQAGPPQAAPLALTVQDPGPTTTAATLALNGTVAGGSGALQVNWASSRGFSGAANISEGAWTAANIALGVGVNVITITVNDAQQNVVKRSVAITRQQQQQTAAGPSINITAPVSNTTSASLTVAGVASDASGVARVTWSNSRGGSGQASGTTAWSAGPITLLSGLNELKFTVYATNGGTSSQTLEVTYSTAVGAVTTTSLAITSPSMSTLTTSAASITVSGTSKNAASVTWTNSNGGSGTATGTDNWNTGAIPLLVGTNTLTIRAFNSAGASSWRSLVVTRR